MTLNTRPLILRLFTHTIFLFFAYACLTVIYTFILAEGRLAAPDSTFIRLQLLRDFVLQLTAINGLLAGGVYIISLQNQAMRYLPILSQAWLVYVWLSLVLVITAKPPLIQIAYSLSSILLILWIIQLWWGQKSTTITAVWMMGMGVIAVGRLFTWDDAVIQRITAHMGLMLAGVALSFWLMHRFSNITPAWRDNSLRVVTLQLTFAGICLSSGSEWQPMAWLSVIFVPLIYMIFAAHSYRALSDHNHTRTLAAHWYSLSIICLFCGVGILGAVLSIPGVQIAVMDTFLSHLPQHLSYLAMIALSLGLINHAAAEMRGENRRITGLLPFWMIGFGKLFGGLAQFSIGLTQSYGLYLFTISIQELETALNPLYVFWLITQLTLLGGLFLYRIGYGIRVSIKLVKNDL